MFLRTITTASCHFQQERIKNTSKGSKQEIRLSVEARYQIANYIGITLMILSLNIFAADQNCLKHFLYTHHFLGDTYGIRNRLPTTLQKGMYIDIN